MEIITFDREKCTGGAAGRLLDQHLADLRKSGLSDAQAAACGFYSECDPHKVVALLGNYLRTASAAKLGACLVIPYHGPDGAPAGYARLKPDKPRTDRKKGGRVIKYESPAGRPNSGRPALATPVVRSREQQRAITSGYG